MRWDIGSRSAVTAGYRFLHISNAHTTGFNPGVDNNVFYASYSFLLVSARDRGGSWPGLEQCYL